jgi:hypothetical protein
MSHSFKHAIGFCDRNPYFKKLANKKVRRTPELPNGKSYKKIFESYDISDFKCLFYKKGDWENWGKFYGKKYKARMK